MSENPQDPTWSGQQLPPQPGAAPWGQPGPSATAQAEYPPPAQMWQPRIDILPGSDKSGRSRGGGEKSGRSRGGISRPGISLPSVAMPNFGKAPLIVLAVALVAGGGYYGWKKYDKPAAHVTVKPRVVVHPVAPVVKPTPVPTTNATISATGWDLAAIHPVSAPVAIAGLAIVYSADGGQLTLNGIQPSTGAVVWSKPASVAVSTPGQPFTVAYSGNTVFFYTHAGTAGGLLAEIEAVDAATGDKKWITDQAVSYADMPAMCSDNTALCDAVAVSATSSQEVRTDATTGAQTVISTATQRSVGTGVWDSGTRSPEYLVHINDTTGATVWRDPVDQIFGMPVSSDNGWNWDSYGSVYVGWDGPNVSPTATSFSLANEETVGIRASDGVRLWRRPGIYGCPSQGLYDNGVPFAVRCVLSGTIIKKADGTTTTSGYSATIQGFNPTTGATLWSDRLGDIPALIGQSDQQPVRVHADVFALTDVAGHTTLINLATGATAAAPVTQTGWCLQDGTFNLTGYKNTDGTTSEFASSGTVAPCTAAGDPSAPTDGTADQVGATAGGYFVWTSTDGLHAFKVGTAA